MSKKDEAWSVMNHAKYEFEDKKIKLEEAEDNYREALVEESFEAIIDILRRIDNDALTESDLRSTFGGLKLTLNDLALRTKQIYIK